jgi:hypothetical protein
LKWPASLAPISHTIEPNEDFVVTNEPVDETIVRMITEFNLLTSSAGVNGSLPQPLNFCWGAIDFDGGEFPDFYDFAVFNSQTSFVAPPSPLTQMDDPWLIRMPFTLVTETVINSNSSGPGIFVESKAKRKLPAGTGILCVMAGINFLTDQSRLLNITGGGDTRMAVRSGFSV